MGVISARSMDEPDEIVSGPRVAKRLVTVGKTAIAHIECQPGWRWSSDIKPTAWTTTCQHHHQGSVLSGRLHLASDEGERVIGAGDALDILPGARCLACRR